MKHYLPDSVELQTLSRAESSTMMQMQLNSMWTDIFTVKTNQSLSVCQSAVLYSPAITRCLSIAAYIRL